MKNHNEKVVFEQKIRKYFHQFDIKINNIELFLEALTHNSYANEHNLKYTYQRMEFLGDAILGQEIALLLFKKYPKEKEGFITNLRSKIVCQESVAKACLNSGLNKLILLGSGEKKDKGYEKNSIMCDIFESILAAIFLDNNHDRMSIQIFLKETLIKIFENKDFISQNTDYKTSLQEYLQAGDKRAISYKLVNSNLNKLKIKNFHVKVFVGQVCYGEGYGTNIKEAEQKAARECFKILAK